MYKSADGPKLFNFKSPYVPAAWVLRAVGCFGNMLVVDLGFVKRTKEAFAVLTIKVEAPVPLARFAYLFLHPWSKFSGKLL